MPFTALKSIVDCITIIKDKRVVLYEQKLHFSSELKPRGYYLEHVFYLDHVIFTNMSHVYYLDQ